MFKSSQDSSKPRIIQPQVAIHFFFQVNKSKFKRNCNFGAPTLKPVLRLYLTLQLSGFLCMLSLQGFRQLVVQTAACFLPARLLVFSLKKSSVKRVFQADKRPETVSPNELSNHSHLTLQI